MSGRITDKNNGQIVLNYALFKLFLWQENICTLVATAELLLAILYRPATSNYFFGSF